MESKDCWLFLTDPKPLEGIEGLLVDLNLPEAAGWGQGL
jgi:hypothetical protein